MDDSFRLAELTGAVARAADVGTGHPPETSLRACLVAVALSRAVGDSEGDTRDVFHASLLRHAGCTSSAHEETRLAGDELDLRSNLVMQDLGRPAVALPAIARGLANQQPLGARVRSVSRFLVQGPSVFPGALRGRCEVAMRFAVRLGLGPRVGRALDEAYERWDGKGLPAGRKGPELSRAARIIALAELAATFFAVGGVEAARDVVRARAGGQVDPELSDCFVEQAPALLEDAAAPSLWDRVLEVEPRPFARVGAMHRRTIAELLADFADLKSIWTLGHSRGVAERVLRAADAAGIGPDERERLELAALVHDVGRVAISNALWDKPGPLGRGELEQVRTHAFHTDRIATSIGGAIGDVASLASVAHERIDGTGYHRGSAGAALTRWARLLAAADVAQALSEHRPHRQALSRAQAETLMRDLARDGSLCPRAVDAVLGSASPGVPKARASYPAGLTAREVDVLRLVARGRTDKEIAGELGISHRTVHHHNAHAFGKIGVSTRAAAALFLVENDLLDG